MNAPPKVLRDQLLRLTGESAGYVPADADAGGSEALPDVAGPLLPSSGQSLPVLAAFQQFLEAERERSRKRLRMAMVWYLIAFIGLAGVLLFVGMFFLNRNMRDLARLHGQMETLRTESQSARQSIQADTDRLRGDIVDERKAMSMLKADLQAQIAIYSNELNALKGPINRPEERPAGRASGVFIRGQPVSPETDVVERSTPAAPEAGVAQDPTGAGEEPEVRTEASAVAAVTPPLPIQPKPASTNTLTMMIVPDGTTRVITWQLPIPQE